MKSIKCKPSTFILKQRVDGDNIVIPADYLPELITKLRALEEDSAVLRKLKREVVPFLSPKFPESSFSGGIISVGEKLKKFGFYLNFCNFKYC